MLLHKILVVTGPSGVGKGCILKQIKSHYDAFMVSISHTTREKRLSETDGVEYHFVVPEIFEEKLRNGYFLEHVNLYGNRYGTSFRAIEDVRNKGKICILEIDINGVRSLKGHYLGKEAHYVFIAPPSLEVLEQRLRGRETENEEAVQKRMKSAITELEDAKLIDFDLSIVNHSIEESVSELKTILKKWYPDVIS